MRYKNSGDVKLEFLMDLFNDEQKTLNMNNEDLRYGTYMILDFTWYLTRNRVTNFTKFTLSLITLFTK